MTSPLQGNASVTPLAVRLPAAKAEWTVDLEAKNATAAFCGGTMTIARNPKTPTKFRGVFVHPDATLNVSTALNSATSLLEAQQKFESTVRNSMSKTHPEFLAEIEKAEAQERIAAAGEDPF